MRKIRFCQNDDMQICSVKLGKRQVSCTLCVDKDKSVLKLLELVRPQDEKESFSAIEHLTDRVVYLVFSNTESIDIVMNWLETLKTKFMEAQNEELIKQ